MLCVALCAGTIENLILHKVLALLEAAYAQPMTQLLCPAQGTDLKVHDVLKPLTQVVVPNPFA